MCTPQHLEVSTSEMLQIKDVKGKMDKNSIARLQLHCIQGMCSNSVLSSLNVPSLFKNDSMPLVTNFTT